MKRIYIASAYSHPNPDVMELRFKEAVDLVGSCLVAGGEKRPKACYYSPIVHNHPPAIYHRLPKGSEYWWTLNRAELLRSSEMWIAEEIGVWRESKGVLKEVGFAEALDLPIKLVKIRWLHNKPTIILTKFANVWRNSNEPKA